MSAPFSPTPYEDVNAVLAHFAAQARAILGRDFVGMYLYGSLALGDFNPDGSDIDFIVVARGEIAPEQVAALAEMHRVFDQYSSPGSGGRKGPPRRGRGGKGVRPTPPRSAASAQCSRSP